MSPPHLPILVVETAAKTSHVCLLLHGGGGAPEEFSALIPSITPPGLGIRYVMPYAPEIALTLFDKQRMRAWYDVVDANLESQQDTPGIETSLQAILSLIETEHGQGAPYDKILVGGFSQGGALALLAALCSPAPLAAAFCLSGYLLQRDTPPVRAENRQSPIFIAHGLYDDLVPVRLAEKACSTLRNLQFDVTWNPHPAGHQVSTEILLALQQWLARACTPRSTT